MSTQETFLRLTGAAHLSLHVLARLREIEDYLGIPNSDDATAENRQDVAVRRGMALLSAAIESLRVGLTPGEDLALCVRTQLDGLLDGPKYNALWDWAEGSPIWCDQRVVAGQYLQHHLRGVRAQRAADAYIDSLGPLGD